MACLKFCLYVDCLGDLKKTPCTGRDSEVQDNRWDTYIGFLSADSWTLWVEDVVLWERFDVQITYTSPPLEDNWAASQLYTAGTYTYKYKQREKIHLIIITILSTLLYNNFCKLITADEHVGDTRWCGEVDYIHYFRVPSPEFLHLSVLLLLQFGDETLQDRHFKLDILRHLVEGRRNIMTKHKKRLMWSKYKDVGDTDTKSKTWSFIAGSHFSVSLTENVIMNVVIYIICDFFSQVFFHEENLADLLTWTLHYSQHQRIVASLQFHTLWNIKHIHKGINRIKIPQITQYLHIPL